MEIRITLNRAFWFGYVLFCTFSTLFAQFLGMIDIRTMGRGEQVIFTSSLILCGMITRYWFKVNYKEQLRKDQ